MGMRIGSGGGGGWANYQATSSVNSHQQRQQGVKNLFSALQSGDVNAAQTAFTALQNQGLPANSPINKIGQALQTGDLASAQKAAQGITATRGRHTGGVRGNDGDADDKAAQSSAAATSSASATVANAATSPIDPAVAFASFMQTLEASLEHQNPSTSSTTAGGDAATAASGSPITPSTQSVLWSQGSGFTQATSAATLKADLDSLIQQMSAEATASADPSALASTATTAQASAAATDATSTVAKAAPAVQSTVSALQSSFSNLMGSLGGQASSASVMTFLKSLDASLSNSAGSLNVTA